MNTVSAESPLRIVDAAASDLAPHADVLSDLFEGRATGMVIHGAFSADELTPVVERLENANFGLERQPADAFAGDTYGHVLIVGDRDLAGYFDEAERFREACAALFAGAQDFQTRIEELLGAVAGKRSVRVPVGPDGRSYSPATIRGLREGGEIDLHCENETVDFPPMWHLSGLAQASNQLSFYVLLAVPESGGELVIHNARYGEGPGEKLGHIERTGSAVLDMLAPYGHAIPQTAVGDLLVFDSGRHFHRVTPVVGTRRRWTIGGFLARSTEDETVYYWS